MNKKEIMRLVRVSPLRNSRLYHLWRYHRDMNLCELSISRYQGGQLSQEEKYRLKKKMKEAMVLYHWSFDEFFQFDYMSLSGEGRRSFVPEYDKNVFCDQVNEPKQAAILDDKWKTYCKFKEFFKRDAVLLNDVDEVNSAPLQEFFEKHLNFVIKPLSSAQGAGVCVVNAPNKQSAKDSILQSFVKSNQPHIIEELINQASELAAFHPQSVNTLRVRTFKLRDEVVIVHPAFRIGQGGSVVDNAGSGGILIDVDAKTGITNIAVDKLNRHYAEHPDSHLPLVGFQIPFWNECVGMAKALAHVLPGVRYVGWDLALTDKGWVLVEGNDKGQFGFQYVTQKGFRNELDSLLSRM